MPHIEWDRGVLSSPCLTHLAEPREQRGAASHGAPLNTPGAGLRTGPVTSAGILSVTSEDGSTSSSPFPFFLPSLTSIDSAAKYTYTSHKILKTQVVFVPS